MNRSHRQHRFARVSIAAMVAIGAGCSRDPRSDRAELERSLRHADSTLTAVIAAKDLDGTTALYDENAELLPVAEPAVVGREAIRREWADILGIPGFASTASLTRVDVSDDGTLGYTRGTYQTTMTGTDGRPVVERGKWVTVWRRQSDGTWRIVQDITNTDAPPPDHQESKHASDGPSQSPTTVVTPNRAATRAR